ncbi:class I SAM-dependent methyltransferase [Streptomyces sp. BE308]|uniref:class I SAM-dependent methyltransferase n=1 Tax=Streptomyces sp. BE308 TaxID=3002529 RepID=UPI002E79868B|nr:class I SAM-dependent methyltransferase [Streptomyces sp. BE308]MEE1796414.1 class I SAM-dependent methyltransferase [Streptomyces sp. BE308]
MSVSMPTAERWVDRWEQQQQRYAIGREERFTVVADVVEHVTAGHERPRVLDLGCGPGSLAARLVGRLPTARIVAVDMDPLLLALGRARHPNAARYVEAVIGEDGWIDTLALRGPVDAIVSTTALHYLPEHVLRRTYAELTALLRPGGVLINADHLSQEGASVAEIAEIVGIRRAERQRAFDHEDWEAWWAAIEHEPELAELCARRRRSGSEHSGCSVTVARHVELLKEAGFANAGPVWQVGNSYVLVAVRR